MKKRVNIDNPFFNLMGKLADLAILNVLLLLCCLPVFTIGASIAALYQTCREMREDDFVSSFRSFLRAFRLSFRQSFFVWVFQLLVGMILMSDLMVVIKGSNTWLWHVMGMAIGCLVLLWAMICAYLLPGKLYEERNGKQAVEKSLYLAVKNLPYTMVMILLNSIPVLCMILGDYVTVLVAPFYLVVGFSATAFINSILLEKCKGVEEKHAKN